MSSMHGTETGWSVEARSSVPNHPIDCGDRFILTNEGWSTVPFLLAPPGRGIPSRSIYGITEIVSLLAYEAAQALRWWFVAEMKQQHKHGIETRLVMHTVKFSVEATKVGVDELVDDIAYLRAGKAIDAAAKSAGSQP
jgi:hypothetical protein